MKAMELILFCVCITYYLCSEKSTPDSSDTWNAAGDIFKSYACNQSKMLTGMKRTNINAATDISIHNTYRLW